MSETPPGQVRARLRTLPAVTALLERPAVRALEQSHGRALVVQAVRAAVDAARREVLAGGDGEISDEDISLLVDAAARSSLVPVLNASGVIVHTNLGRAPLATEAIEAVTALAAGYSTLEYDLEPGKRGSRHYHATALLKELSGAEDAAVVNNNAAAVLLTLSAFARGREVVVSRGELVEIGGGFRIPDVMRQSGAQLVEVGTTNRTHLADYEQALSEGTALLLKVHRSNFEVVGFTSEVGIAELSQLARRAGVPLVYDAGSGLLRDVGGARGELTVAAAISAGADLVTFSGDKLLGGPQAGLIVGRGELVAKLRKHPLMRPLRPDKLCLAALRETLRLWRDAWERVPVARMLALPEAHLRARAEALVEQLADALTPRRLEARQCVDRVGGGASPLAELPGWALRVTGGSPDKLAAALRAGAQPVIARVEEDAVWLHLRCVPDEADALIARALRAAREANGA